MSYQWSPSTRVIVITICLLFIGATLYAIRSLLGPIVLSFFFAYMLLPLVKRLRRRTGMSRRAAVTTVYFSVLILLVGLMSTILPTLIRQVLLAPRYFSTVGAELEQWLAKPIAIFGQNIDFRFLWNDLTQLSPDALANATDNALLVLETTSLSFAWLLIVLVTTFYLLLDWDRLLRWLIQQAPPHERHDLVRLLSEIDGIWRAYIRGMFRLSLIVGVLFFLVLALIGLPGAPIVALLTGLLVAIPEVGPVVSSVVAVLVALVQGSEFLPISNFWFAVLVGAIYFVIMQFLIIWLQPRVMGSYLKLNTGLVFVALIGAILMQGVLTAFVIVPVMATLGVLGGYLRSKLLNLDPWDDQLNVPPAEVAQREAEVELHPQPSRTG